MQGRSVALYKGKRRLYVRKSPTEVLLLLPKSRHSHYTGPATPLMHKHVYKNTTQGII